MLVQSGVYNLAAATSGYVTLDPPVPVGKSFVLTTQSSVSYQSHRRQATATLTNEIDDCYTRVTFRKGDETGELTIAWQVITSDEITVQSGAANLTASQTEVSVTISEVNLDSAFCVLTARTTADMRFRGICFAPSFNSKQSLKLQRGYAEGAATVVWQVVEWERAEVIRGSVTTTAETTEKAIADIDPARSFLLYYPVFGNLGDNSPNKLVRGRIKNNVALEFNQQTFTAATVYYEVITHTSFRLQTGTATATTAETNVQITRPKGTAFVWGSGNSAGTSVSYMPTVLFRAVISQDKIILTRDNLVTYEAYFDWQLVEWVTTVPPESLAPDEVAIMPSEPNAFRWVKEPAMVATAYEIAWRELEGDWETSGKVNSSAQQHTFPADTFEIGKEYEWRVRHWDDQNEDPSDWAVATFNTIYPIIHNPFPAPESSIKVDIQQLGAVLKSPFGRDIELKVEIADSEDFADPIVYELPLVHSGQKSIVDHAMTQAGYWWVRMTAIDTLQEQTVLTYRFFAGQFLQFIDFPDIQTQGPQATHITVRAKGTTTEYTAVISPEPPAANKIERLVEIESGTQAQCQKVAEQLLERWGREQRSVSGTVDLIVTLRFDQKIRVKCLPAGIDEEMILQKKEHDVLGNPSTRVTLGDIILSDDELLARVLDELVG